MLIKTDATFQLTPEAERAARRARLEQMAQEAEELAQADEPDRMFGHHMGGSVR